MEPREETKHQEESFRKVNKNNHCEESAPMGKLGEQVRVNYLMVMLHLTKLTSSPQHREKARKKMKNTPQKKKRKE